jgi:hypothetical protein
MHETRETAGEGIALDCGVIALGNQRCSGAACGKTVEGVGNAADAPARALCAGVPLTAGTAAPDIDRGCARRPFGLCSWMAVWRGGMQTLSGFDADGRSPELDGLPPMTFLYFPCDGTAVTTCLFHLALPAAASLWR